MLDLDFSQEQEMLRSATRDLLSDYCSLANVRDLEDDPIGYSQELWTQMAKLDLVSMMLGDEFGGPGMSMIDAVVVYEELGRHLAPTPHLVSSILSQGAIMNSGSQAQKQDWIPRLASGDAILTTAWLEPNGGFGPEGIQLVATSDGTTTVLSGIKHHVPFAKAAQGFLVLARSGSSEKDIDLYLVDSSTPGISMSQKLSIASDTQYEVRFDNVEVGTSSRIGEEKSGWDTWEALLYQAIILIGAYAEGAASHALEITVQYAKDRHQFDKPLGAFQALAHYLADAQTNLDGAVQLVHEAAWAFSEGKSVEKLAPMAKLYACKTFRDLTAMAQQIFGGIGFTVEFDIQLFFRRAKALQISWWNDRYLKELIAKQVLDA